MVRLRPGKSAPVGVVGKIIKIFEALRVSPSGLQLRDIAAQTGLNKSTAYRFLAHLEKEGYVFRDEGGAYMIGIKLIRLGSGLAYQSTLRNVSRPFMQKLASLTSETVNLATLDGREILYLDVIESPHTFRLVSQVGMRRPLYCTALGKVIIAFLPEADSETALQGTRFERLTPHTLTDMPRLKKELAKIRQQGFALDDQEAYLGSRCIGVAIFDATGKAVAGISISGPTTRVTPAQIGTFSELAKEVADEISTGLGYEGPKPTQLRRVSTHTIGGAATEARKAERTLAARAKRA
jgi:DNA-binding IclR family transcriptional regulator